MARPFKPLLAALDAPLDGRTADASRVATLLRRRGVSPEGVRQVLASEVVTSPADRGIVIGLVGEALDLAAEGRRATLLPAVQYPREAASRHPPRNAPGGALGFTMRQATMLERLGVSALALQQFVTGSSTPDARRGRVLLAVLRDASG